jgi:ankyrin repeat protein
LPFTKNNLVQNWRKSFTLVNGRNLYAAISEREGQNVKKVTDLLANPNIDLNWQGPGMRATALINATLLCYAQIVKLLLEVGANPNLKNIHGTTALMAAAVPRPNHSQETKQKIIALLINAGANVDAQDNNNETPLMHAVRWANEAIVDQLLAAGANPDITNLDNETALIMAEKRGLSHITPMLKKVSAARKSK